VIIGILAGLGVVMCIGLIIFSCINKKSGQIKFASVNFLVVICTGAIICLLDVYLWIATETTVICIARIWVVSLGFTLMYGGLFVKTWRVWKIFGQVKNNSLNKANPISDGQLFGMLGVLLTVDIIILIMFTLWHEGTWVYPPVLGTVAPVSNCAYNPVWPIVFILLYSCAILLFGVFLAVSTRYVVTTFNESKYIGFSIYNCAFMALIAIPIIALVSANHDVVFVLFCLSIIIGVIPSVIIIFLPKITSLWSGEDYHAKFKKSIQSSSVGSEDIGLSHKLEQYKTELEQCQLELAKFKNQNQPEENPHNEHERNAAD